MRGSSLNKLVQISSYLKTTSIVNDHEIYLLHFLLGHLSFYYLQNLFLELFKNKQPSQFQCDIGALTKQHKASYSPWFYQQKHFSLIHSGICGPSKVITY